MTSLSFAAFHRWPVAIALTIGLMVLEAETIRCGILTGRQSVNLDSAINGAATDFMANACHVGLSIAIASGKETKFYNYGSTSRTGHKLPNADSIYEIGSVTKTFTGALAAKAIVDHRMELDADFRKYLPQSYPNLVSDGHPITLRTLATHRSGLPRDLPSTDDLFAHPDYERLPNQMIARDSGYDRSRYLRELHTVRLTSEPGSWEVYSNLGIKVIGFGLEKVYGIPFEMLMKEEILDPVQMSSTALVLNAEQHGRLVQGYSRGENPMPYHLRNAGAAYGLYSTTRDMARYIHWQLDESDAVIHLAHSLLHGDAANGRALIWNLTLDRGSRVLWHGGGTFGMTSQVVLFPDEEQGYVLLANDACKGTEDALKDIAITVHNRSKLLYQ